MRDETGTTQVEFGLIAVLLSIVVIAVILALGPDLLEMFDRVENWLGEEGDVEPGNPPHDDDV